jgi:hypothetical protein
VSVIVKAIPRTSCWLTGSTSESSDIDYLIRVIPSPCFHSSIPEFYHRTMDDVLTILSYGTMSDTCASVRTPSEGSRNHVLVTDCHYLWFVRFWSPWHEPDERLFVPPIWACAPRFHLAWQVATRVPTPDRWRCSQ